MNRLREDIMGLPEEDRLEYALDCLDEIRGVGVQRLPEIADIGLTPVQYTVVATLLSAAGRTVTRGALYLAVYGGLEGPDMKIIDVFICHARKKLPQNMRIENIWGVGYRLDMEGV